MNAYGWTSTFAFVRTFISDDLPTFGKPERISDLETGSMLGSRARCCRTCSRYASDDFCCRMIDAIRPSAARLSCLQRYSESPYLMYLTYSVPTESMSFFAIESCASASL